MPERAYNVSFIRTVKEVGYVDSINKDILPTPANYIGQDRIGLSYVYLKYCIFSPLAFIPSSSR